MTHIHDALFDADFSELTHIVEGTKVETRMWLSRLFCCKVHKAYLVHPDYEGRIPARELPGIVDRKYKEAMGELLTPGHEHSTKLENVTTPYVPLRQDRSPWGNMALRVLGVDEYVDSVAEAEAVVRQLAVDVVVGDYPKLNEKQLVAVNEVFATVTRLSPHLSRLSKELKSHRGWQADHWYVRPLWHHGTLMRFLHGPGRRVTHPTAATQYQLATLPKSLTVRDQAVLENMTPAERDNPVDA